MQKHDQPKPHIHSPQMTLEFDEPGAHAAMDHSMHHESGHSDHSAQDDPAARDDHQSHTMPNPQGVTGEDHSDHAGHGTDHSGHEHMFRTRF